MEVQRRESRSPSSSDASVSSDGYFDGVSDIVAPDDNDDQILIDDDKDDKDDEFVQDDDDDYSKKKSRPRERTSSSV